MGAIIRQGMQRTDPNSMSRGNGAGFSSEEGASVEAWEGLVSVAFGDGDVSGAGTLDSKPIIGDSVLFFGSRALA